MKQLLSFSLAFLFLTVGYCQKKYDVVLPSDYTNSQSYPLFIVFHGGNGNKKDMQTWWTSDRLSKEFIVAYFEATTLDNRPNRWGWRNLPKERVNIKQYYTQIINSYSINTNQVYVGGFSLGGKMSIDLALNQIIPVKGLISLNHGGGTTKYFTSENIEKAASTNMKVVLLSGERDYRYQKETLKIKKQFETFKLQHQFIEIKGLGHASPKNFSKMLDTYIDYLIKF